MFGQKPGDKKSGDSKLQDAEKARDESQKEGSRTIKEQLQSIPEELADVAERAAASGTPADEVAALKKLVAQAMDQISKLQKEVSKNALGKASEAAYKYQEPVACSMCEQAVDICGGVAENHVSLRVLPESAENMEMFPGITWNGITYVGICVVPRACADGIKGAVQKYEDYRMRLRHNHGRILGNQRAIMSSVGGGKGFPIFDPSLPG